MITSIPEEEKKNSQISNSLLSLSAIVKTDPKMEKRQTRSSNGCIYQNIECEMAKPNS